MTNYKNVIYNADCIKFMEVAQEKSIDIVMTSPFYNTARNTQTEKMFEQYNRRYDVHMDDMTDEEYVEYSVNLFNKFDRVIKENGVILYNISYSTEKPSLMWLVVAEIIKRTGFMVADTIIWKKPSALPNNMNHNRLTRIIEYVFVFCRKSEAKTFSANKTVISVRKTGQKNYENVYNFVEARNNDGANPFNKATYSSELCEKLLSIYAKPRSVVYDSFMGTGTTAVAALRLGHSFIGTEISENQCKYAIERIEKEFGTGLARLCS